MRKVRRTRREPQGDSEDYRWGIAATIVIIALVLGLALYGYYTGAWNAPPD